MTNNYKESVLNRISLMCKSFLHKVLRRMGFRAFRIGPYSVFDFESFLYRYLAVHNKLLFVQIGANDGVMNDPIYRFNMDNKAVVSGYALEPLPDVYERLVENYKCCPNIKLFNFAIHATDSEMVLHRVKPSKSSKVPAFARGIASFDPEHWRKSSLVSDVNYIEEVKVKCETFANFIKINSVSNIDLLLIDTEGYDYQILMSIDFDCVKPKIIRFEHGVRDSLMSQEQLMKVCNHLNGFGYQIIAESYDITAYLLDPNDLIF